MKKLISARLAGNSLLIINTILLVLHILILLRILPYDFIWGGQIKDNSDLIRFEGIAIFIQLVFILITALKIGYILVGKFKRTANVGIWLMFGFLLLNTAGNLASSAATEKMIFTPLTIVMAALVFRLAIEKEENGENTRF